MTIAICVQAGRGFAAAHEEGVLHRDFKPENVLVDEHGRARVLDFGLARATVAVGGAVVGVDAATDVATGVDRAARRADAPSGAQTSESGRFELDDTLVGSRPALGLPLTQLGAIVGTPAYMPPEQMRGETIDARSDQFAFCVAAYEALYGRRPFEGETLRELVTSIEAGRLLPPPRGSRVPRAALPILARGLAAMQADRWPSMTALLDALERAVPAGERRTALLFAGLAVAVVVVAAVVIALRPARAPVCSGTDQPLAGVWDGPARAEVAQAFRASGNANAEPTLARVTKVLDDYAAAWGAMSAEACVATRVRGVQSDEALDLRTGCLDGRLEDVRAVTALFRHADGPLVDNALGAVLRVPPLAGCADVQALRAAYEPIGDADKQRAVAAANHDVADVVARYNAGRCEEAMPLARAVADRVQAVGYRPAEAEALYWRGRIEHVCGDPKAAAEALFTAVRDAEESHQDRLLARILIELAHLQGTELARYDEAEDFARVADAVIRRVGAPDALLSELARARAWVEYTRGDLEAALPLRREALERHQRAVGDDDPDALQLRAELGDLEYEAGKLKEALAEEEEVLRRSRALLGARHMRTGRYTLDVAETLIAQGKYEDAAPLLEEARALVSPSVLEHERYVEAIERFGSGDVGEGDERFEACVRAAEAHYGKDDSYPLSIEGDRAKWLAVHGRTGRALDLARALVQHIEKIGGRDNPWYPNAFATLALVLARSGHGKARAGEHADEAIPLADHAIALAEKGAAQQLPFALLAKGEALLGRGARAEAALALERALALMDERGGIDGIVAADLKAGLARAVSR